MNRLFPLYYKGSGHQVIDESCIKMASCAATLPSQTWSKICMESLDVTVRHSSLFHTWGKNTKVSPHGLYFDVANSLTKSLRGTNTRLYTDHAYSSIKLFSKSILCFVQAQIVVTL